MKIIKKINKNYKKMIKKFINHINLKINKVKSSNSAPFGQVLCLF